MFDQKISRAHIGREHTFLDQAMGIVTRGRHDIFNLAAIGKQHHRLCGIEVDRAAFVARRQQYLKNFVQMMQVLPQSFIDAVIGFIGVKQFGDVGIGAARGRVEHRFHKFIALDFTRSRD